MRPIGVAEVLEFGHELAAAVDLHRLDIERRLADQVVEESCGAGSRGERAGAHAAKLRDRADGLGLLDCEAGLDGDARMVDLHHLAGLSPAVAAAPALSVAVELALPLGLDAPAVERDRLGPAGAHQAGDHAPGGGLAGREAELARQHGADLGAPPQRKALARLAHQLELGFKRFAGRGLRYVVERNGRRRLSGYLAVAQFSAVLREKERAALGGWRNPKTGRREPVSKSTAPMRSSCSSGIGGAGPSRTRTASSAMPPSAKTAAGCAPGTARPAAALCSSIALAPDRSEILKNLFSSA